MSRMRLGVLVLVCMALVGAAIGLRGQAQVEVQAPVPLGGPDTSIISGENFGFRVDGRSPDGRITGTLMVRIKGQWMPVGGPGTYSLRR